MSPVTSQRSIHGVESEFNQSWNLRSRPITSLSQWLRCQIVLDCSFVNSYCTVAYRYKRIFSIGTKGITTYNPSNLEVTNQVSNSDMRATSRDHLVRLCYILKRACITLMRLRLYTFYIQEELLQYLISLLTFSSDSFPIFSILPICLQKMK